MSKLLLFLSTILLYCSCSNDNAKNKNKLISQATFTEIYLDSLKKQNPGIKYTIKKDLEILVDSNDLNVVHHLDNAYTSYKNDPDSLAEIIHTYLKLSADLYKKEEPVQRNKIIPVVKDASYIDDMALTLNQNNKTGEPVGLVYEKYNDKLVIIYAEDGENGIAYFTTERFRESGINKDSLFSIAIKNLDAVLPEINIHGEEGYYMITAGGNYEASLILLKSIWTKENLPVRGDIIITMPTRDLLLVTGSKNADGINKMRSASQEAWKTGPYQLIPDLFRWNGKKFEPYE